MTTQLPSTQQTLAGSALERRFHELAEQWRDETGGYSVIQQMTRHPAYREIVAMGLVAVPWILRNLEANFGFWWYALEEITGEDPVGRRVGIGHDELREGWLHWAGLFYRKPVSRLV